MWGIWLVGLMTGMFVVSVTGEGDWFDRGLMLLGIFVFSGWFFMVMRRPLWLLFGGKETRRAFVERLRRESREIQ